MSSEAKTEEQIEVPPQQYVPELVNEEEEKVDEELQKEMQKIKIDESVFTGQDKKPHKDKKEKDEKKNKKKGIDFMDYANQNNIHINIQYEEDKYPNRKNYKNFQRNDKYNNNYHHNYNNNYNNNNNNNNKRGSQKYNKGVYKKQNRFHKFGGNKFDTININHDIQYQNQNNFHQTPILNNDKDILSYLESIFEENNLNKDLYIRYRLTDKGQISVNDLLNYNSLKKNNITAQKIKDLIQGNQNLEYSEVENNGIITVKNFKNMNLNTIDQINANKKTYKMMRAQQNMYQNQMGFNTYYPYNYNYIYLQNNIFIPSNVIYPNQQLQQNQNNNNQNEQK